jgi:hypothetical protein
MSLFRYCAVNEVKRGPKRKPSAAELPAPPPAEVTAAQKPPGAVPQAAEGQAQAAEGPATEEQAQAPRSIGELLREGTDVVVVDEAHVVKNEKVGPPGRGARCPF